MYSFLSLFASALLMTSPALADDHGQPSGMSFEQVKQRRLQRIDQMRACVAKATSFEQMKACKPERKRPPGPAA
ncbi:MAG: hypothetical protein EB072_07505 [Betaproteobacteria bacterium]|nr:hypothetical protein [Betaproteobacteria bacterium]